MKNSKEFLISPDLENDNLTNIFHEIDKKGENEFLEIQNNCLKVIENYSLEKFSEAVKKSALFSIKKKKFSILSLITSYLLFLLR